MPNGSKLYNALGINPKPKAPKAAPAPKVEVAKVKKRNLATDNDLVATDNDPVVSEE